MTRQIKFRAWDGERMKEVLTLGLNEGFISTPKASAPIEDFQLMQFTELLDKHGKEIYEGDIVVCKFLSGFDCEDKYEIAHENNNRDEGEGVSFYVNPKIVEFKNGEFTPREEYYQCSDGYYSWRTFDIEVLGNIYENPELLTNK